MLEKAAVPDPPERWSLFFGPDALAPLAQDWGVGDYQAVLAGGESAARAALGRGHSDRALSIDLLRLDAAEASLRRDLVKSILIEAEPLALKAPGARGQLSRFLVATARARVDFGQRTPDRAALQARAGEVTALLAHLEVDQDLLSNEIVELPLLSGALGFWTTRLVEAGLLDEARALLFQTALPPLSEGTKYREEESVLDRAGLYFQVQALKAETFADITQDMYLANHWDLARSEKVLDDLIEILEGDYSSAQEQAKKQSIFLSLYRGNASRSLAIAHEARARLVLATLRGDSRPLPVEELRAMDQHLRRGLEVALEMSDSETSDWLELDYAEALFLARPEGWEQDLDRGLSEMLKEWGKSPNQRVLLFKALMLQGRLRDFQQRPSEAIASLSQGLAILEAVCQEIGAGGAEKLRQSWKSGYDMLARLQLQAGQTDRAVDTLDRQSQLTTVTRFPVSSLRSDRPELRGPLQEAAALQQQMANLQRTEADPKLLAQTQGQFYQVLNDLQRQEPSFGRLAVRPSNFSRLQKSLPPDSALVLLFPAPTHLYLIVATRENLRIRQVEVPPERLDQLVAEFRRQTVLYGRQAGPFSWSSPAGESLASIVCELGEDLWAPLAEDLQGKKLVAFIPTGSLAYFPMQALARPRPGQRPHFLAEDLAVAVITKSSDLDPLGRPEPDSGKGVLVLADPDGSLRQARLEAQEVGKLFPQSEVLVGQEATADHLRQLKPEDAYLHLATHGILNPGSPMESYLLVAGGSGQLSVGEIAGLNLAPVRLVTLSACQSALADRNPEVGWDLASLADAFGFAGSPTMVASLWKVSDQSTRQLMVEFYRHLTAGEGRAEALRQAEVSLLERPETAHPFHWAPFVLIGDWR